MNYILSASLTGSLTTNGSSQAVIGSVVETLTPQTYNLPGTTGTIQSGVTALSTRYKPVYITDKGNTAPGYI